MTISAGVRSQMLQPEQMKAGCMKAQGLQFAIQQGRLHQDWQRSWGAH